MGGYEIRTKRIDICGSLPFWEASFFAHTSSVYLLKSNTMFTQLRNNRRMNNNPRRGFNFLYNSQPFIHFTHSSITRRC